MEDSMLQDNPAIADRLVFALIFHHGSCSYQGIGNFNAAFGKRPHASA
jgi:hypothetical protein